METALTTAVSVAAVAVVGKIVFDWLKTRNGKGCPGVNPTILAKLCEDVSWTRSIHERFDSDGSPLWYVPRTWKEDLDRLNTAATRTNVLLEKILEQLRARPL